MGVVQAVLPLCIFGFLLDDFSFGSLYSFLISSIWLKKVTIGDFNKDLNRIFSLQVYSQFVILLPIILLTDVLRPKTILISKAASAILLWCLFRWTTSVGAVEFATIVHSFYYCCDVAYVSYMFDKVSSDNFLIVASLTYAAQLAGNFINVLLHAILKTVSDYNLYTYLLPMTQIAALLIAAIFLNFNCTQSSRSSLQSTSRNMITQLQTAASNQHVVFHSIWYIFCSGVYSTINAFEEKILNHFPIGHPEMAWQRFSTVIAIGLSMFFVLISPHVTFMKQRKQNTLNFLAAVAFTSSILIFLFVNVENQFIKHICFWFSHIIFHTTITISSAEIARGILHGSYALIFGILIFLGACLNVILMKIIDGLNLMESDGLSVLGGVVAFVGFAYIVFMVMCNVRTSNPGAVLSTPISRDINEQTMNIEKGPVENSPFLEK